MSKTIRFTKTFGKYKVDDRKKVTDSDAFRLSRLGLAEVVDVETDAGTTETRMLTTGGRNKAKGKSKSETKRLAAQAESAPAPTPEELQQIETGEAIPADAATAQAVEEGNADPLDDSSAITDDSSAAA